MINLLKKLDGSRTLKKILDELPHERAYNIFNFLYKCSQHDIIYFDTCFVSNKGKILLGDMLVAFSYITQAQFEMALRQKREAKNKNRPAGEILLALGFLKKDELLDALKL